VREITIPVLNTNDVDYVLVEWYARTGDVVTAGQPVAMIETSKATEDLEADVSGTLDQLLAVGSQCRPGTVIGRVYDADAGGEEAGRQSAAGSPFGAGTGGGDSSGPLLTDAARSLVAEHGVSADSIRRLGKRVVRSADILDLVAEHGEDEILPLSSVQRAVAATVNASLSTPTAFTVVKVYLGNADAGHADLVIAAVAAERKSRPVFFGSLDGDAVRVVAGAHIAVTVDTGDGLYLPVIRNAQDLAPPAIAAALLRFRVKARKKTFTADELRGGNIGVTLHTESDIVVAQPLIHRGHTCSLAVCSVQAELAMSPGALPRVRHYFHLGLAYDHRVVNGRDAILFLDAIKRCIERGDASSDAAGGPVPA